MNAFIIYAFALGAAVAAPAPPDFSGTWSLAAIRPAPATAGGGSAPLPPGDITIQQTTAELKVSRTAFGTVTTTMYALDGRESTNKSGAMTKVTRARWDAARLIVEGRTSQVTSQGYAAWKIKEVYSLDPRGRLLIESESVSDDGTVTKNVQEWIKTKSGG